ncbi:MAG: NAD(P)/FAD-dependent oxidoreductase [Bacillota bacterium]
MKIAIIGAGPAGLACARECERLGVIPDVFERNSFVGWVWPSVTVWLNLFKQRFGGEIIEDLRNNYKIDIKPLSECKSFTMKSPSKEVTVKGNLGYFIPRGAIGYESLEQQLLRDLKKTTVHFNRPADYKELSKKYDCVVVANGKDTPAKELGVWKQHGVVHIIGGVAIGSFKTDSSVFYLDTEYAGQGYARITPFSFSQAIVGLYYIGPMEPDLKKLFTIFIEKEGLEHLEFIYKLLTPLFSTGTVTKFRVGNILLAGRAAGLTDRLIGTGAIESMISGIMAARAMIRNKDYDSLIKPSQEHLENISIFREEIKKLDNAGYDKLLEVIGTPGIKQAIYNSGVNFTEITGKILRLLQQYKNTGTS